MLIIVLIGFINEKVTRLTYEIALLMFSIVLGAIITAVVAFVKNKTVRGTGHF